MSSFYISQQSGTYYPPMTTSGVSVVYPNAVWGSPQLPAVLESPSAPLGDCEWLDAQIAEVCDLAVAA